VLKSVFEKKSGVTVGPATHGQGVFAAKRFRPGQVIGEIEGILHKDPDYGSNYCINVGGNCSLEPHEPFRFLNHCCEPNAKLYIVYIHESDPIEGRKVVVEALKNIQPGSEILIDYEWAADAAIRCGCGAANCRGWVVGPAELHIVKKRLADQNASKTHTMTADHAIAISSVATPNCGRLNCATLFLS